MPRILIAPLTVVALLVPATASAESVAVFIHETEFNGADTEAAAVAMTAVIEAAGGTAVWLTDPEDIRTANQALEMSCPVECFRHFAAALGVEALFSVSVWRVDAGASLGMAYRAHNRRHSTSRVIGSFEPDTVLGGVRSGYDQLRRWDDGHAPVLRVITDPPGAAVVARGQPLGATPLEVPMAPGQVTVNISLHGYEPVSVEVTVPVEDEANVELELEPLEGSAGPQAHRPRSIVPGVILASLGVVGLATVGGAAAVAGCDSADAGGRCYEPRSVHGGRAAAYGVAAGVLLVGGVVWAVRARNHNERSAEVHVGLGTVEVRGRF